MVMLSLGDSKKYFWPAKRFELCIPDLDLKKLGKLSAHKLPIRYG
jgi:hypothetical protein